MGCLCWGASEIVVFIATSRFLDVRISRPGVRYLIRSAAYVFLISDQKAHYYR